MGNWPFGAFTEIELDTTRNIAFCGSGGGVYILDITTPENITKLSESIHTGGSIRELFYDHSTKRLYVGAERLEIWDVEDLTHPIRLGCFNTLAYDIAIVDSYAYVADDGGVRIVNVSDPTTPYEVGYVGGINVYSVEVSYPFAYVGSSTPFMILDISDPANPVQIGKYPVFFPIYDMAVTDSLVYIVGFHIGLRILNVSDPTDPIEVGHYDMLSAWSIAVTDSYAYIAGIESSGLTGIRIINILDPTNPYHVASYITPGYAHKVAIDIPHVYVADGGSGLTVIDVTCATMPTEVGHYDSPGAASDVVIVNSYAYVAADIGGLRVINILDPTNPYELGYYTTKTVHAHHVAVEDIFACMVCGDSGIKIIDISNPSYPCELGGYNTPGYAYHAVLKDLYAYIADGDSGLRIIDVLDPTMPFEIGNCHTPGAYWVAVSGSYAYVTSDSGLKIIDVSERTNPHEVGCYAPGATFVAVSDTYAYIIRYTRHVLFEVLNVSNPAYPTPVGYCAFSHHYVKGMSVSGSYVYFVTDNRLIIIDVSEPTNPHPVGYYNLPQRTTSVAANNPYVYVTNSGLGLQIYENLLMGITESSYSVTKVEIHSVPNPFANLTTITYELPVRTKICLQVYDLTGRLINTLVEKVEERGHHMLIWDAKDDNGNPLSTGVYLLKLSTPRTQTIHKVVILR